MIVIVCPPTRRRPAQVPTNPLRVTFVNRHYDDGRAILNAEAIKNDIRRMAVPSGLGGAQVEIVYLEGSLREQAAQIWNSSVFIWAHGSAMAQTFFLPRVSRPGRARSRVAQSGSRRPVPGWGIHARELAFFHRASWLPSEACPPRPGRRLPAPACRALRLSRWCSGWWRTPRTSTSGSRASAAPLGWTLGWTWWSTTTKPRPSSTLT